MSINLVDPGRSSIIKTKEENEIREIFHQHWEKMKKQLKAVINEIGVWRSQSIQDINSYADQQLRMLKTDYDQQRGVFDQKREANIHTARAYNQAKVTDPLFNELRQACQELEFHVAQLEYVTNQNERPQVITVGEQIKRKSQDTTSTNVHGFEDRRIKSTIENPNITKENGDNISRSSFRSISNHSNQWSSMTSASNVNDQSTSNNNNSRATTTNVDDSNNKCPMCFMIFPSYMTQNDRHQHVSEHMLDDDDEYGNKTTM